MTQLPTSLLPKKKLSMKWMYKFYSTVSCSLLRITGLCEKFINPFSNARLFFHQGHKLTLGRMPKTRRNFLWLKTQKIKSRKIKTVKWKHWEMFACGASWTSNLVQTSFDIFYFSNLMTTSLYSLSIHPWHTSSFLDTFVPVTCRHRGIQTNGFTLQPQSFSLQYHP